MAVRRYYWNPLNHDCFVDHKRFIFAFKENLDSGTWNDLHVHAHWGELAFVASGSIVMCTSTGNFLGQSRRAIWVPPGMQHEWYMPEACDDRTLFIHPSVFGDDERFSRYHAVELTPLLREMIIAHSEQSVDVEHEEGRRFGLVLIDCLKRSKEVGTPLLMPHERRLVELCTAALAAPDQPVRIEDWSRQLGMSPKTLARLFVRQTGRTFGRWQAGARMQSALARMQEGESVTDAAFNCGYTSVSAFITAFKRHFGQTPGTVLKHNKE